jgi:TolA-binding protein
LGQYFAIKQQTDKARATYQRVVDTYTNPAERTYREQAARALKDLDILSPAATRVTP